MLFFMLVFFLFAVFVSIYLKWPQFRAIREVKKSSNKKSRQTFYLSLATNLGVGNLVGVTAAIVYGGPGVIFWMAIFAFFASAVSFMENYYAINSQVINKNGKFAGTCYTIVKYLNGRSGKLVALIFSLFLILTNTIFFPPIQINAIVSVIPNNYKMIGIIALIIIISIIIFNGIKSILKITDFVVPIMAISYFIILIVALIMNFEQLDDVLCLILKDAFNIRSLGFGGFFSMFTTAISKSLFSHEAGLGTIPSLTGVSDKQEIKTISYYQLIGVIVDTVILCTLTGIFILLYSNGFDGNNQMLLVYCFQKYLGNFGLVICSIFIFIFGFTSVIGQYYLGENNAVFLSINGKIDFNKVKFFYRILFLIGVSIGVFGTFSNIIWLVDIGIMLIGTINIIILFKIENCHKLLKNIHKNA